MKRNIAKLLALLLALTVLCGCSTTPKEYTCDEMTMTVPGYMRDVSGQEDFSYYTFALDSPKIAIFGLKEAYADYEGTSDMTLEEYTDLTIEANGLDVLGVTRSGGDYMYFTYTHDSDEGDYKYLTATFKTDEAFWMIQIASLVTNYDETAFFGYLDSVSFS